jgi:MoxR-like ATPase
MKVIVNYPSFNEELGILKMVADNFANQDPISSINKVLSLDELAALRTEMANIYVDPKIDNYIVSITQATRKPDAFGLKDMIEWGASPRASIALKQCARALAFLRGKNFVSPDEVKEIAHDVLRHRILPSYEAEARGVNSDEIIRVLLKNITVP